MPFREDADVNLGMKIIQQHLIVLTALLAAFVAAPIAVATPASATVDPCAPGAEHLVSWTMPASGQFVIESPYVDYELGAEGTNQDIEIPGPPPGPFERIVEIPDYDPELGFTVYVLDHETFTADVLLDEEICQSRVVASKSTASEITSRVEAANTDTSPEAAAEDSSDLLLPIGLVGLGVIVLTGGTVVWKAQRNS